MVGSSKMLSSQALGKLKAMGRRGTCHAGLARRRREALAESLSGGVGACKNILLAAILLSLALAQAKNSSKQARGYIELTKDGYRISNTVTFEAGLDVEGDVLITGNWISKNYSERSRLPELGGSYVDECTPQRKGAIRWAYTIFEACDGAAWVPLRHCSRNCGFFLPPLPQVDFRTYLCAAGCCPAKLASTAGNLSAGKRMNQSGCIDVATHIEFQSFDPATMDASPQSLVEEVLWPQALSKHGFSTTLSSHWASLQCKASNDGMLYDMSYNKKIICDVLPAPAVRGKVELVQQCKRHLPLAEGYRAALLRRACQGVHTHEDAKVCLGDISKFLTWGDSDTNAKPQDPFAAGKWQEKQLDYQMQPYNLWGDAPWFPFEREPPKGRVGRLPKKSPDTFIPPADWALELHTKEGCDKYNYNWSAFDHLRALYNVSGWAERIPGVKQA